MSLQIFVIPTGARIVGPDPLPPTLNALQSWIAKSTAIPTGDQILLTAKGKHVRLQNLLTDTEIFLYDRALFTSTNPQPIPATPIPPTFVPSPVPDTLTDRTDLRAWQALFRARREWAGAVYQRCRSMGRSAEELTARRAVIEQGLRVATVNHDAHLRSLVQRRAEMHTWFDAVVRDVGVDTGAVDAELTRLEQIPARKGFGRILGGWSDGPDEAQGESLDATTDAEGETCLAAFVDRGKTKAAVEKARRIVDRFATRLDEFSIAVEKVAEQFEELKRGMEGSGTRDDDEPAKLLAEVEVVATKVAADCETVFGLPGTEPKATSQASKIALQHTRNLLPALQEYAVEMSELVRQCTEQKNDIVERALDSLQLIARVESEIARLNKELASLRLQDEELVVFDRVTVPTKMPSIYGTVLVEAVRRQEWIDKMKHDSSTLAEEIAGYQEEEKRRRKKWVKNMKDIIPENLDGKVLGVEINLQGEDNTWPPASRKDLDSYMKYLQSIPDYREELETLQQEILELDKPTKQQVKRAKTFKMGSIHEAGGGFGKGSLMLRGEDEAKIFKEANLKLEDELKGHRSRIRKLEDMLHRSTQTISRLSMGGAISPSQNGLPGSPGSPSVVSEHPVRVGSPGPRQFEEYSRRPSVSSRRFSSNQPAEDKASVRKILQLETELAAEKEARANLANELFAKKETEKVRQEMIDEAISTKRDLMQNMEAQGKEFALERRALEEEITRYKARAEEVEDEMDRIVESRENERIGGTRKLEDARAEVEEREREMGMLTDKIEGLEGEIQGREQLEAERKDSLLRIYGIMAPTSSLPGGDVSQLIFDLESIAQRSIGESKELAQDLAMAMNENRKLNHTVDHQARENGTLTVQLSQFQVEIHRLKEELASSEAKATSLASELEEDRTHLHSLRAKFAEGETGSESLRQRLNDEEQKVTSLNAKLAETKSHVNSLDVELFALQKKYAALQDATEMTSKRLAMRGQRAKELTQRLYANNDRLNGMLEALGFAVTYEDGVMSVQRASKVPAGAATGISGVLPEGSTTLPSSATAASTPSPARRLLDDLSSLTYLLWTEKDNETDEALAFSTLLSKLDSFSPDVFTESISKRLRDMEHTARKWQREARGYREKGKRSAIEAHDKIAFRNFRVGDLALFLPTRNQAMKPWAAFNVGAPHFFLREQEGHRLRGREWLVARIRGIEERVVDLSRSVVGAESDRGTVGTGKEGESVEGVIDEENPFDLSDGLRWYLLDAVEEKITGPAASTISTNQPSSTLAPATTGIAAATGPTAGPTSSTVDTNTAQAQHSISRPPTNAPPTITTTAAAAAAAAAAPTIPAVLTSPTSTQTPLDGLRGRPSTSASAASSTFSARRPTTRRPRLRPTDPVARTSAVTPITGMAMAMAQGSVARTADGAARTLSRSLEAKGGVGGAGSGNKGKRGSGGGWFGSGGGGGVAEGSPRVSAVPVGLEGRMRSDSQASLASRSGLGRMFGGSGTAGRKDGGGQGSGNGNGTTAADSATTVAPQGEDGKKPSGGWGTIDEAPDFFPPSHTSAAPVTSSPPSGQRTLSKPDPEDNTAASSPQTGEPTTRPTDIPPGGEADAHDTLAEAATTTPSSPSKPVSPSKRVLGNSPPPPSPPTQPPALRPPPAASASGGQSGQTQSPTKAGVQSPSASASASASVSPAKGAAGQGRKKGGGGVWDSLFKLDVSFESHGGKKKG